MVSDQLVSIMSGSTEDVSLGDDSLCRFKCSTVKFMIQNKMVSSACDINKIKCLTSIDQVELYLQQFAVSDGQLLDIYRGALS